MSAAKLASLLRPSSRQDAAEPLDPALLDAARRHGIGPLLYAAMRDRGWLDAQPDAVRRELTCFAREAALVECDARRELERVLVALSESGVRPLLFKGGALAYTVYSEPWLRPRVDTDLLVRREQVDPTSACLARLGYAVAARTSGELVTHQITYETSAGRLSRVFDVHWKVSDPHVFADLFSYDELECEAVRVRALGAAARTVCDVHALLLACTHRVAHHYDDEILVFLVDLDLLARRLDDASWDRVAALAAAKRIRTVTARGLDLAVQYLDTPVPARVRDALSAGGAAEPTARYLDRRLRKIDILFSDLSRLSWRNRLRLVREHLLPPAAFVLQSYGQTRRPFLTPLYLYRVVRGVGAWFRPLR